MSDANQVTFQVSWSRLQRGCKPGLTPLLFQKTIAQDLVHLHRNDYVAAERCVRESYR